MRIEAAMSFAALIDLAHPLGGADIAGVDAQAGSTAFRSSIAAV